MITRLLEFFGIPTYDPAKAVGICFLPAPITPKAKTKAPKATPTIFPIDEEKKFYGFRMDATENREGATAWLTAYDNELLSERGLSGGKKVVNQNEACKRSWYGCDSVVDAAKVLGLSGSWIEKRFAVFSAALSVETSEAANTPGK